VGWLKDRYSSVILNKSVLKLMDRTVCVKKNVSFCTGTALCLTQDEHQWHLVWCLACSL